VMAISGKPSSAARRTQSSTLPLPSDQAVWTW